MKLSKGKIDKYLERFDSVIRAALNEDIGLKDITTDRLINQYEKCDFIIVLKEDAVICGIPVVLKVYKMLMANLVIDYCAEEGSFLQKGSIILKANGVARKVLYGERVALNFLQRMCGIATLTRRCVEKINGLKAKLLDTRKTTPVLRAFEKYAVLIGGGTNHRYDLNDGILIKENHLKILSKYRKDYIKFAIDNARMTKKGVAKDKRIVEIEVTTFEELKQAVESGADMILLDNMSVEDVKKAVEYVAGRAKLEASGGITEENIREYAETGVDFISIGALTHSVKSIDITLKVI